MSSSASRKEDHLDLCARAEVGFPTKTTLLEQVELVHDALPPPLDRVDSSCVILGKRLSAPLVIAALSGGIPRGDRLNLELAALAGAAGFGLGVGSQRSMLEGRRWPDLRREGGRDLLLLGNLGLAQVRTAEPRRIADLAAGIGADALCVHLNAAQEAFQPEGDRDFSGAEEALARLVSELPVPVMVKETGCGLSPAVLARLKRAGVRHVDVSGAGGTSWVAVELLRHEAPPAWAADFRDWGLPTAPSLLSAAAAGFETVVASGGLRSGLEAAKAVALGAHAAGFALPVLRAWVEGGVKAVEGLLGGYAAAFKTAMALCGAGSVAELRGRAVILGRDLRVWLDAMELRK